MTQYRYSMLHFRLKMGRLGAIIVCVDINETTNNDTVKMVQEEGNVAFGFQCDVSDCAHVESIARQGNSVGPKKPSLL